MPGYDTILQYGAPGVVLFAFLYLIVKGVPAFKAWLDSLLVTFKEEIAAERALGQQLVQKERDAAAEVAAKQMQVLDKHTTAVDSMRQTLTELVQKANRP